MSNVETAIEGMIQNTIDEQDFVCRLDAEQYTDDQIAGLEDKLDELVNQFEEMERRMVPSLEKDGEPRAVNQIDWIMTPTNIISGYDSKALLLSYIGSVLAPSQSHQAEMVIGMVLATARNLIDKQLKGES